MAALTANDIVTVLAFTAFSVSNTYTQAEANARFVQNTGDFSAGKNKILNGDFSIWQRGTTFTNPSVFAYNADRWQGVFNGTTTTCVQSQQAFTYGTAPVAGYEGTYFLRQSTVAQSGASVQALAQRIEDVRTFAGQTVTLSFWAKADTSRTWTTRLIQSFGSGGSGDATVSGSSLSVTTSWTRFTQTFTVPSIASKTIGAGSYLYVIIDGPINTGQTMDIWGVQLEAGSIATAFQTATGTLQGELAACQRYFEVQKDGSGGVDGNLGMGFFVTTTTALATIYFTVKRSNPSVTLNSGSLEAITAGAGILSMSSIVFGSYGAPSSTSCSITGVVSSTTVGLGCQIRTGSTAYSIWIDSEL
jgi:hypothetical protein